MTTDSRNPCCASRRRAVRFDVPQFVPVNWGGEPALVLNLCETGMAIQAMEILELGRAVPFTFELPGTNLEVVGTAKIVWSDCSGRVGAEFVCIPQAHRYRLNRWATEAQLRAV